MFRRRRADRARTLWEQSELELHDAFRELALSQSRARGIRWSSLEWNRELVFARDRHTGLITALAGFSVAFEPTGLLEDEENASLVREATAVFHYQRGQWGTGGKTLFNMGPQLALARLSDQFEPLWPESLATKNTEDKAR